MKCSYYQKLYTLNTSMKFFMVVVMCMAAEMCETIYEKTPYTTRAECQQEAATVRNYMMETFPMSAGEIYCLNNEEFLLFNEWMENGGNPTLGNETSA